MIPYSVSLRSIVHADACFFDASIASPAGEGRAAIPSRRLTALIACLSAKNPTTCSRSESLNPSSAAIAESERQSRSDLPLSFSRFNARSSLKPSFSGEALISSNENKMSDGHRERVWMEVKTY